MKRLMLSVLCAAVGLIAAASGAIADKLHLTDGRVLEGEILREVDGWVQFRYEIAGIEQTGMFRPEQIARIERDAAGETAADRPPARQERRAPADRVDDGRLRGAVISLGGGGDKEMVGVYMTAHALREAIPLLEEEGIDVVVFHINSGGGLALEVQRLSDVIHEEYKPKFRVAAWIEWAISAAAMTAHCVEEIYFMPDAAYGACTMYSGNLVMSRGRDLEEALYMMEKVSARGGYSPYIMRSMQVPDPLSCTQDENGEWAWYNTADGDVLVNPAGRILTFNAVEAERFGFSLGTAATLDELSRAMKIPEIEWVGVQTPGALYPVCKAEQFMREYRDRVYNDQQRYNEYLVKYAQSLGYAQQAAREDRGPFVGKAREALHQIVRAVKNNPNFMFLQPLPPPAPEEITMEAFNEWVRQQEEMLRNLMR